MKTILEQISETVSKGFEAAGYDPSYGKAGISNRPDLCEFQCNGAMAGAKTYHKAPMMIAEDVAAKLADEARFASVNAVAPGFLNISLSDDFLADHLNGMVADDRFGLQTPAPKRSSLTTAVPMLPSRFTWDICVPRSSERV